MTLTSEQIEGLDVALNEATLLGIEFDPARRVAGVTLEVLALPAEGPAREDDRVLLVLEPVGRIAASLRHGAWDDRAARVESFDVEKLHSVVAGVAGNAVYGWEFFDTPEERFREWADRLSLDWRSDAHDGCNHTVDLFQEAERHLDVRIWFDVLHVVRPDGAEVPLDAFIADGRRWWDAFHSGDPRTAGHGIVPLGKTPGLLVRALLWLARRR